MSNINVKDIHLSIVLIGQFNPAIVTPQWLALKKLIRESEAENSSIQITHPEVSQFSLPFADFSIVKNKFQVNCSDGSQFDTVRDLVTSIFIILSETPVSGIGINHIYHFDLSDHDTYFNFGNWLSPQSIWDESLKKSGLIDLKVIEADFSDTGVKKQVQLNPSELHRPYGAKFQLNYHIELTKAPDKSISNTIIENWEISKEEASTIFKRLINTFKENA